MKKVMMLGALSCAVLISSCNVNDDITDNTDNGAVRFTAGIAQVATSQVVPGTRAAEATWGSGDAIGIFMVESGGITTVHEANKRYTTTTGDGSFTAATGNEIYYPMSGSKVDFIAYYPYDSSVTAIGNTLPVDVSGTQSTASQAGIDLLWAKANNGGSGYDKETHKTTSVALTFDHKLAKLVMNCQAETNVGITGFDNVTVSINGMNTKNTLSLANGTLGVPGTTTAITPRKLTTPKQGFMASYDAIILPGSYSAGDVTVTFTIPGGEPFTWTLKADDAIFAGGNEYIYEVTLTRTGVKVTGTINPWNTTGNNRGPVTAE